MWTLWYHDPANNDYSLQSYIRIFEVKDVSDFWTIVDGIPKEMWESGMFFFMRMFFFCVLMPIFFFCVLVFMIFVRRFSIVIFC